MEASVSAAFQQPTASAGARPTLVNHSTIARHQQHYHCHRVVGQHVHDAHLRQYDVARRYLIASEVANVNFFSTSVVLHAEQQQLLFFPRIRKRGSMFLPALVCVCVSVCDHDN